MNKTFSLLFALWLLPCIASAQLVHVPFASIRKAALGDQNAAAANGEIIPVEYVQEPVQSGQQSEEPSADKKLPNADAALAPAEEAGDEEKSPAAVSDEHKPYRTHARGAIFGRDQEPEPHHSLPRHEQQPGQVHSRGPIFGPPQEPQEKHLLRRDSDKPVRTRARGPIFGR
ncbi:MAG: hypothetical protein WCU88_13210 [Elusimicrobiota bacterium]